MAVNTLSDRTFNEMMVTGNSQFSSSSGFANSYSTNTFSFQNLTLVGNGQVSELVNQVVVGVRNRDGYLKSLYEICDVDTTWAIVDIFIEKTLYANKEDKIFEITYEPKNVDDLEPEIVETVNVCINEFIERVDLYSFIKRTSRDFILYGETPFRKEVEAGVGIVCLNDDISVTDLVGVYNKKGVKSFFMVRENQAEELSADNYGHFIMDPVVIRTTSKTILSSYEDARVVMGKSILYGAIEQLKRLRTNQIVDIISDIKNILRPNYYGVSVPENTTPQDVVSIVKKYERDFRSPIEALGRDSQNLSVNDIVSLAAQVRFIPQFSNGKGSISTIDSFGRTQDNTEANLAKRNMILQTIAVSVGLPPSYLSPTMGDPVDKTTALKIYSRFAKKVATIQDAYEEGIKDLVIQDLRARTGYTIKRDSLKISFKSVIDAELLDQAEYTGVMIDIMDRFQQTVDSVNQGSMGIRAKQDVLLSVYNKLTNALTISNLFESIDIKDETEEVAGEETMGGMSAGPASVASPTVGDSMLLPGEEGPEGGAPITDVEGLNKDLDDLESLSANNIEEHGDLDVGNQDIGDATNPELNV